MKTLLGLTVANLKGLTRDRAALFWTFFFPIMFVLLFGVLFSGSSDSKVTVGWVDQDGTAASAGLRQAFANVPLLTLQNGTLADEKAAMQKGDISAIIVIPKGFQDAVVASRAGQKPSVPIDLYTDPAQTQTTQVVQGVVTQIANGFNLQLAGGSEVVTVSQLTLTSSNISTVDLPSAEHSGHGPDAAGRLRGGASRPAAREGDPQADGGHAAAALEAGRQQHPAPLDRGRRRHGPDHRHRRSRLPHQTSSATWPPRSDSSSWARGPSSPSASCSLRSSRPRNRRPAWSRWSRCR